MRRQAGWSGRSNLPHVWLLHFGSAAAYACWLQRQRLGSPAAAACCSSLFCPADAARTAAAPRLAAARRPRGLITAASRPSAALTSVLLPAHRTRFLPSGLPVRCACPCPLCVYLGCTCVLYPRTAAAVLPYPFVACTRRRPVTCSTGAQ